MGRRASHEFCQTCRDRHLKCDFKTIPCDNCAKSNRECRPSDWFLFRPISELRRRHRRRSDVTPSPVDKPGNEDASRAIAEDTDSTVPTGHQSPSSSMVLPSEKDFSEDVKLTVVAVFVNETVATIQASRLSPKRAGPPRMPPLSDENEALDVDKPPWEDLSAGDTLDAQRQQGDGIDDGSRLSPELVWHESRLEPSLSGRPTRSSGEYSIQTTAQNNSTVSTANNITGGDILQSIADSREPDFAAGLSPETNRSQYRGHPLTPSSALGPPTGPETIYHGPFPLNNAEASLFRYFIQVWGPLLDSTDESKQFSTCVPYLAKSESPCLMYAIFALVSCQLSRTSGYPPQTSKLYRKKCAQVLVSILSSDPDSTHEASIFATYVLLRVYDHLHISATLTERRPESLFSNALALSIQPWHAYSSHARLKRAAFWIHLRQDIHVALQLECTVQVDHTLFEQTLAVAIQITDDDLARRSSTSPQQERSQCSPAGEDLKLEAYDPGIDCAWTNRLVGLACEVVNYCFGAQQQSVERWTSLMTSVESWNIQKPVTFEPFFEQAPHATEDNPFPAIHLLNDWHVLGLMYYHLSVILLKSNRPGQPPEHKNPRTMGYSIREDLIHHANMLCGIVWTNPTDQALLIISAMLNVSARVFSDVRSQKGVLDLLDLARKRIGAHTSTTTGRLIDLWNSLPGSLSGR